MAIKVLLQTTIPTIADDWSITRFSLLTAFLRAQPGFEVTARDRTPPGAPDPVLASLGESDFDEAWIFAVDCGDGLTEADCEGISRFRRRGSGLLVTRDHMDLGSSVCTLGGVGKAHYFHSRNLNPDASQRAIDDPYTTYISWPNFHSGANGDFQAIETVGAVHPVLVDRGAAIRFLPSHPHEGDIGAPDGEDARVIALGRSKVTGRQFNIAVAFEPGVHGGPAIAQSTFHHFVDYNWDPGMGCPTFVSESPGDGIARNPQAMLDTHRYISNVARWLARRAD